MASHSWTINAREHLHSSQILHYPQRPSTVRPPSGPPQPPSVLTCMAWPWEQAMTLQQNNYHHYLYQAIPEFPESYEREHMFEKLLTPSDVGKLNRLVIPKQHAEKYFPLDNESAERGLLLSFEDKESGTAWRFRYSYWSSSQSYVLTKGWSRFVKEKRLDPGDVVLFERWGLTKLYIGCRRNPAGNSPPPPPLPPRRAVQEVSVADAAAIPWSAAYHHSFSEEHAFIHEGNNREEEEVQNEVSAPAKSKQFRLFGVDFECLPEPPPPQQQQQQQPPAAPTSWFFGHIAFHLTPSNASSSQLQLD